MSNAHWKITRTRSKHIDFFLQTHITCSDQYTLNVVVFFVVARIWNEIRNIGKMELLRILFVIKLVFVERDSVPSLETITPETFFKEEPPTKIALSRWKIIIESMIENELI